jgi:hypothetical protein
MDYDLYSENLKRFYFQLPKTSIRFLLFYADDLSSPKVNDVFRVFPRSKFLIVKDVIEKGWQLYSEQDVRYLMETLECNNMPEYFSFSIVNHKNIIKLRLILTQFEESIDDGDFYRFDCSHTFVFNPNAINEIENTKCVRWDGTELDYTMSCIYPQPYPYIMKHWCKAMLDTIGNAQANDNSYIAHGESLIQHFTEMKQAREDLLTITVMYDEQKPNRVVVLYDYGEASFHSRSIESLTL